MYTHRYIAKEQEVVIAEKRPTLLQQSFTIIANRGGSLVVREIAGAGYRPCSS